MDNLQVTGSWHGIDVVKTETISAPLMSIKATAMNKGRARVWLESSKLGAFGFTRGTPITVTVYSSRIVVSVDPRGDRIVAGRDRGGKSISILDLCMPNAQREAVRGDSAKFSVYAEQGLLTIVGA